MGRLSWRASVWFTVAITDLEVAMAVAVPLRSDFEAAQLRALAKCSRDPDQTRRLLARAAIYDGASRTEAAQIGCVTLQIVRDWVLRFNARGPDTDSGRWTRVEDSRVVGERIGWCALSRGGEP